MTTRLLRYTALVMLIGLHVCAGSLTPARAQCAPGDPWIFPYGCWEITDSCCFTATCFAPNGSDVGGCAVACLPLTTCVPPDSTWWFRITVPEAGDQCEDPRESYARVGVILCGRSTGCEGPIPSSQQDYVALDFDPNRSALGLLHFDHGAYGYIFNSNLDDVLPYPLTGTHDYEITRSADGEWSIWIDGELRSTRTYFDLPDVPGHLQLVNVYCSGATFCLRDELEAVVDLVPKTVSLQSQGNSATCYIELPEEYDPANIDVSTVFLDGAIPAVLWPTGVGDYDMDGTPDRMVKFARSALIDHLAGEGGYSMWLRERETDASPNHGDIFQVTVSGRLFDATSFSGVDEIRVINPGHSSDEIDPVTVSYPFAEEVSTSYGVLSEGPVTLRIYDAAGRLVRKIAQGQKGIGLHQAVWDSRNGDGRRVEAGIYFIAVEQRGAVRALKTLIVR